MTHLDDEAQLRRVWATADDSQRLEIYEHMDCMGKPEYSMRWLKGDRVNNSWVNHGNMATLVKLAEGFVRSQATAGHEFHELSMEAVS
jgi:hypothetical protein